MVAVERHNSTSRKGAKLAKRRKRNQQYLSAFA